MKKLLIKMLAHLYRNVKVHKDVLHDIINKADANHDNFISVGETIAFIGSKIKK